MAHSHRGSREGVDPMGMDKLTKAANAAGFAMVNSEEFFAPEPRIARERAPAWKPAATPVHRLPAPAWHASGNLLREWWYSLAGRATA
jgi:hypothetical protein